MSLDCRSSQSKTYLRIRTEILVQTIIYPTSPQSVQHKIHHAHPQASISITTTAYQTLIHQTQIIHNCKVRKIKKKTHHALYEIILTTNAESAKHLGEIRVSFPGF